MLEITARDYIEVSHRFGILLGMFKRQEFDEDVLEDSLTVLWNETVRLGLDVTKEHLVCLLEDLARQNPKSVSFVRRADGLFDFSVRGAKLDADKMVSHIETLYKTLRAELGSIVLRAIPKEKTKYLDPKWLLDTPVYKAFPESWKEFQCAGRCYAYGENTACAFHLQRVLEWGLKSLAVHLGKPFNRNSWDAHLKDIEKELEQRYRSAGARTPEERLYSEAAVQFGNMKVAWRNPTMHIEAKYDDKEASYLLMTTEAFMNHLAKKGLKE